MTYQWERIHGADRSVRRSALHPSVFTRLDRFSEDRGSRSCEKRAVTILRTAAARSTSSENSALARPERIPNLWPRLLGLLGGRRPGASGAARSRTGPSLLRIRRAWRAVRSDDGTIAPAAALAHPCRLLRRSRCPPCVTFWSCTRSGRHLATAERLQSQRTRRRFPWLGLRGPFRSRPGGGRADDRKLSVGLIWKLMRDSLPIRNGLTRAGFTGGWL